MVVDLTAAGLVQGALWQTETSWMESVRASGDLLGRPVPDGIPDPGRVPRALPVHDHRARRAGSPRRLRRMPILAVSRPATSPTNHLRATAAGGFRTHTY